MVQALGLTGANGVNTPGLKVAESKMEENDEIPLSSADSTLYRACAARANFMALDRPDIAFATKELCGCVARPHSSAVDCLKKLAK